MYSGIESDGYRIVFVFLFDGFFRFAIFRAGRGNFDAFRETASFTACERWSASCDDARHGVIQFVALDHHVLVVLARQHGFVIGELAGEHARNQQALADPEK